MIEPSTSFPFKTEILSQDPFEARAAWTVPANLPYFEGHFPDMPVLPAVAIVDASAEFLKRALAPKPVEPKSLPSAKFLRPIQPGQNVEIRAKEVSVSEWSVEWREPETGHSLATLKLKN